MLYKVYTKEKDLYKKFSYFHVEVSLSHVYQQYNCQLKDKLV